MSGAGIALWVVVTTVGTVFISGGGLASYLYPGSQGLAMILLAVLQWLILRWWIPGVGWWAPLTLAAWALGPSLGLTAGRIVLELLQLVLRVVAGVAELPPVVKNLIGYAFVGVVVGLCQWLVLERVLARARWWIVVCALTWGVGEVAAAGGAELADSLKETTGPELWYAGYWGTNAIVHAVATGAALAWLTRGVTQEPVRTGGVE